MDTITLRGSRSGCAMVALFGGVTILVVFHIYAVKVFLDPVAVGDLPYFGYAAVAFATLAIPVPIIVIMIKLYRTERQNYVVTKDGLLCYQGKLVIRKIPRADIRLFGSFAVNHRCAYIFFCTASDEEIIKYAKEHWSLRTLSYTQEQLEELEKTSIGIWQIQVTLYIHHATDLHKGQVTTIELQNNKNIAEISELWGMQPFLAGSYALLMPEYFSGKKSW